jgi:hypothetical protein
LKVIMGSSFGGQQAGAQFSTACDRSLKICPLRRAWFLTWSASAPTGTQGCATAQTCA